MQSKLERALAAGVVAPPPGVSLQWVHPAELPRYVRPIPRIIAVGGDGTVNLAARWLREYSPGAALAVVPAGTGNNLARGLGLPLDPERALRLALGSDATRRVDVVRVEARLPDGAREFLLLQSAALGLPARVAARYDAWRRCPWVRFALAPFGPWVYRLLATGELLGLARGARGTERAFAVRVQVDAEFLDMHVLAVFINNERSLGGNFLPTPDACLDDGRLDLCLVRAQGARAAARLFARIARGTHGQDPTVTLRQGTRIEVALAAPAPLLLDGDLPVVSDRYVFELLPAALSVVVGT